MSQVTKIDLKCDTLCEFDLIENNKEFSSYRSGAVEVSSSQEIGPTFATMYLLAFDKGVRKYGINIVGSWSYEPFLVEV